MRNATDAAFILPDGHVMKKYLHDFVQRSVQFHQNKALKDQDAYWETGLVSDVTMSYQLWQQAFFVWSLDNAARKGFYPEAAQARELAADILYRLYECIEEYKAPDGKTYRSKPEMAIFYNTAVKVLRWDFADMKKNPGLMRSPVRCITNNTGEMFYYTMLAEQWGNCITQALTKDASTMPDPTNTGKRILEPEDWKLDPEFIKKYTEKRGMDKKGFMPGYHEEANAPTSAALARYDNPRAQKMYEIVRGIMADFHAVHEPQPKGIEYVK
jgi:hypothetical protein